MSHEKNIRGMLSEDSERPWNVPSAIYSQLNPSPRWARRVPQQQRKFIDPRAGLFKDIRNSRGEERRRTKIQKKKRKKMGNRSMAQTGATFPRIAPYCAILRDERKGRKFSRPSSPDQASRYTHRNDPRNSWSTSAAISYRDSRNEIHTV